MIYINHYYIYVIKIIKKFNFFLIRILNNFLLINKFKYI